MIVWLMLTAGQWTFWRVNVMCDDLGSLTLMWYMLKRNWNHPRLQTIKNRKRVRQCFNYRDLPSYQQRC